MKDVANQMGRPIWLTEVRYPISLRKRSLIALTQFSATGNQTAFLESLMPWMDAQPFIQRYSWFMCSPTRSGTICGADGYPNALGQVYELF